MLRGLVRHSIGAIDEWCERVHTGRVRAGLGRHRETLRVEARMNVSDVVRVGDPGGDRR